MSVRRYCSLFALNWRRRWAVSCHPGQSWVLVAVRAGGWEEVGSSVTDGCVPYSRSKGHRPCGRETRARMTEIDLQAEIGLSYHDDDLHVVIPLAGRVTEM